MPDRQLILGVDKERPEHVQLHGAPFARLVKEVVGRRHIGPDGSEMGWPLQCRCHLHHGGKGTPHHAHLAA